MQEWPSPFKSVEHRSGIAQRLPRVGLKTLYAALNDLDIE
ncbi:MAG: hypothetical protein ACI9FJ_000743 [Alteromonadaceae bacterium]|jgi:hypothetical protein